MRVQFSNPALRQRGSQGRGHTLRDIRSNRRPSGDFADRTDRRIRIVHPLFEARYGCRQVRTASQRLLLENSGKPNAKLPWVAMFALSLPLTRTTVSQHSGGTMSVGD